MSKTKLSFDAFKTLRFLAFKHGHFNLEAILKEARERDLAGRDEVIDLLENREGEYYKLIA